MENPEARRNRLAGFVPHTNVRSALELGDRFVRNTIRLGTSFLRPSTFPSATVNLGSTVFLRTSEAFRTITTGASGVAVRELVNKSEVFFLVLGVGRILRVPKEPPFPLRDLVDRASKLEPFPALWAVEGLGHLYAESVRRQGATPCGLLREDRQPDLPAQCLTMLHAGIGLSFARRELAAIDPGSPRNEIRLAVAEVVRLCQHNSRPGYVGAAYESLGLQTYDFHPTSLTPIVGEVLREIAPQVVPFFWHGVGRAIYFDVPVNFLLCSGWEAFETARRVAPDESALLNAWAGLTWAFALVNQRHPEVLADLLLRFHGHELRHNEAFSNGIASSMIMRYDTTPEAPFIRAFCEYRPDRPDVADLWDELVRTPCRRAIDDLYPDLRQQDRLGEVFRYHDLPAQREPPPSCQPVGD